VLPLWSEGGALEIEVSEANTTKCSMNVTRCRYAEMYKRLGLGDYGHLLSCSRDFAFVEGFNPNIKLTRTQTIMEGADFCDFRFKTIKRQDI
jgi:fumarate reductase iron-sulfur subunit